MLRHNRPRLRLSAVSTVLVLQVVSANALDVDRVLTDARGKVVHLMVNGDVAQGENFKRPIHGSGVVVRTSSTDPGNQFRILTAGHVVKDDNSWARLGTRPDRDVYITTEQSIGAVQLQPVTGVLVNGQMDIAQVVAGPRTAYYAELLAASLEKDQQYVVVSWGLDSTKPRIAEHATAKVATIVGPDQTDPTLVRLRADLVPTESGSPLLDGNGAVVAIVVMREESGGNSSTALALPVRQAWDWIEGVKRQPVREPRPQQLNALVTPPISPSALRNLCVFLGKSSALARDVIRPPDAPFGRELLQAVVRNPNSAIGRSLSVTPEAGAINIRSRCPDIQEGKAYYGSIVSVLDRTAAINLRQVLPLRYLDDDFFWGTISEISIRRQ